MKHKSILPILLFVAGTAAYLFFYYATPILEISGRDGPPLRRAVFLFYLLRPDDLLRDWLGASYAAAFADRIPVLLLAGGIGAYATSLGWLAMALTGADRGLTRLERFVFSCGVGLNLVSTYVLLVGLLGWLHNVFVFAMPAAATLAATAWTEWRHHVSATDRRSFRDEPATGSIDRPGRRGNKRPQRLEEARAEPDGRHGELLSRRWLWLVVPFAVVTVLGGMMPPIEFDVREYHLQVPKEFFQQGYIGFLPHNVYGNMAMGSEMLSLLSMVLAGDWWFGALAGKTLIAALAPLTAVALFAAGRRFVSTTAGVVAAAAFISIPWIVQVSTLGLVDGAAACYLFLAFYAVLLSFHARQPGSGPAESDPPRAAWPRLLLAGYLAGAAVSTKYPAALFVALPLTALLAWAHLRQDGKRAWKPLAVFLLATVAGCGLWFGKNWALTGNPTYPLLYHVFGGETRTPEKNARWTRAHQPHDFSPATLAGDLGRVGLTSPWISPIVIPLAVLALLRRKRPNHSPAPEGKLDRRAVGDTSRSRLPSGTCGARSRSASGTYPIPSALPWLLVVYFVYVLGAWWLLTHRIDRFWIPALPLLALLAGLGARWQETKLWRGVLVALLVFGSAANFVVDASPLIGDNRFFVPLDRLRVDPLRVDPWHRYFNAHVSDGCILMVGDAQVFDVEPPVIYDTCFDASRFEQLVKGRSPQGIRSALESHEIQYIYVHWGEIARYRATYGYTDFVQPEVFDRLVAQRLLEPLPAIEGHSGRAYRVLDKSESAAP